MKAQLNLLADDDGSGAVFSADRRHRYFLLRRWAWLDGQHVGDRASCVFIMLNPSTADEARNDPTIRRCIGYAKAWGFGGAAIVNLYAFRATDPADLDMADDPVGPENDDWIRRTCTGSDFVICAWGTSRWARTRAGAVLRLLVELGVEARCLRQNAHGDPLHPLYQPKGLDPVALR